MRASLLWTLSALLGGRATVSADFSFDDFSNPRYGSDKNSEAIMAGAICGITSGVVAYIFGCHRTKKKTEKEKSELLRYIKLQNNLYDVAEQRWKEEYDELYASYLSMKKDTEDRDYDEFKAPDTDGDDRISEAEFNIYIRKYLSSFPELSDKDFPKFSEFDVDESGLVTFQEWQKYIELQKEIEAKKTATGALKSDAYGELLDVLYNDDSLSGAKKNEKGNGVGSHKRYS